MKKLLLSLALAGLFLLALGGVAGATALRAQATPAVSAVTPASGANDIDTPVTITGAGFAASATASLGTTRPPA